MLYLLSSSSVPNVLVGEVTVNSVEVVLECGRLLTEGSLCTERGLIMV